MRWHQPTGPLRLSIIGLVKLNALFTINFINSTTCILEGGNYLFLHTVLHTVLYIVLHIVLYTVLHIVRCTILYTECIKYCILYYILYCTLCQILWVRHFVRHQRAEQIILEPKLAKRFSSNIEVDGPLMSEIRYFRRKYTPKLRRLSTKLLTWEAESGLDKPPLKRQRIFNIVNKSNNEQAAKEL